MHDTKENLVWKKAFLLSLAGAGLLAAAAFFIFSPGGVKFDGDRVRNTDPERFFLSFRAMNTDDRETLLLREGDVMRVSWQIESGQVDIRISMAGEAPVYQANGRGAGDAADFEVAIPKSGEYTVSIFARNARGRMEFTQIVPE